MDHRLTLTPGGYAAEKQIPISNIIKYANKEYKHNGEIFKRSQSRRSDRNTRTS